VDISGGIQASLAGRYALALFALASEQKKLEAVGGDLAAVSQALAESAELKALTTSPLVGREEAAKAVAAAAAAMKLDTITANFLGVLARNRRLAQLPGVIRAFNTLSARHRGELTAEVVSAHALDDDQVDAIKQNLRTRMGRDINVDLNVDPAILGGLVVKIGSQMIDGSIRTKLNTLAQAMKG
jgi:F-type H+-transporting ATPase subunit delta